MARTWIFGRCRGIDHGAVKHHAHDPTCLQKSSTASDLPPSRQSPSSHTPMSVNQRGKIVGQVVRPGVAASDRKQKRLSTTHPRPLALTAQDIIEISSDEDEDLQPPPKRILLQPPPKGILTKHGRPTPARESDYKTRCEIERLKKVRHQRLACGSIHLTLNCSCRGRKNWNESLHYRRRK